MSAVDVVRAARKSQGAYVLRESNHPLVYIAVAVFSFAMPLAGVHHVAFNSFWSLTAVEDDSMYPTLVAGDQLLVDRVTFQHRAPVAGELVTFTLEDGAERVARVIGEPGDLIVLSEEFIFVNDAPILRRRLDSSASENVEDVAGSRREELGHFIEEQGRLAYHVALPRVAYNAHPEEWQLGADEFLLLHDNRAALEDSRRVGPVARHNITGRPVYIGYSDEDPSASGFALRATGLYQQSDEFRTSRRGRRVQPAPPPRS
jgi:signal peptidase I